MNWDDIKHDGSEHYKTGAVEPIDLYRAGGILQGYCVSSIIKYAYRNRNKPPVRLDMEKIKHLAEMMIALGEEAMAEQVITTTNVVDDATSGGKEPCRLVRQGGQCTLHGKDDCLTYANGDPCPQWEGE